MILLFDGTLETGLSLDQYIAINRWETTSNNVHSLTISTLYVTNDVYLIIAAVQCPKAETISNANLTTHGTTPGDTIIYMCQKGYYHSYGNLKRTCKNSGSWNGRAPICSRMDFVNLSLYLVISSSYRSNVINTQNLTYRRYELYWYIDFI